MLWTQKIKKPETKTKEEKRLLISLRGFLKYDQIILVKAPKEKRINRIINRDKCNRQDAIDRINNQIDDEDKVDESDYIIENINIIDIPKKVLKIHKNILNSIKIH